MNVTHNMTGTLRAQMQGRPPLVFDARGNGGGKIVPTITGDHNAHISDYTAIVVVEDERKTLFPGDRLRLVERKPNCADHSD